MVGALWDPAIAHTGVVLLLVPADPLRPRRAHELPGWHPALAQVTPAAAWTAGDGQQEFRAACERLGLGSAVLRDYVKSMKRYWHLAACIPDAADRAAAWKVATRFRHMEEAARELGYRSPRATWCAVAAAS